MELCKTFLTMRGSFPPRPGTAVAVLRVYRNGVVGIVRGGGAGVWPERSPNVTDCPPVRMISA